MSNESEVKERRREEEKWGMRERNKGSDERNNKSVKESRKGEKRGQSYE